MLTTIPKMDMSQNETGCCPRFQPESWDGKTLDLSKIQFARASTRSFLYMPLNMGKVMKDAMEKIEKQQGSLTDTYLTLAEDVTPFKCNHYFAVTKKIDGLEMSNLAGTYKMKVFEGPFSQVGKWMKAMKEYGTHQKVEFDRIFSFYTTCPECAKVYGKNYVVLFGRVKP